MKTAAHETRGGMREVTGRVNSAGVPQSGTNDFIATHVSAGTYTIQPTPPLRAAVTASACLVTTGGGFVGVNSVAPDRFEVWIRNSAGAFLDSDFTFNIKGLAR